MATRKSAVASAFGAVGTTFDMITSVADTAGKGAQLLNNYVDQALYEQQSLNSRRRITFDASATDTCAHEAAQARIALKESLGEKLSVKEKKDIVQSMHDLIVEGLANAEKTNA